MSEREAMAEDRKLRDELRLQTAASNVRSRFPPIGQLDFVTQFGEGPGFAEFFPPDEGMNPNPGKMTIEVRRRDLPDKELEAVILGDALHGLAETNEDFRGLKQQFIESMTPQQLEVAREMHQEDAARGSKRSFEDFLDQSGADAFIRDFVFQRTGTIPGGQPFLSGFPVMGGFFPQNMPSLEAMEALLNQGGGR